MSASLPASAGASAGGNKPAPPKGARYPKSRRIRKRKDFLRVQERPDAPARRPAVDPERRPAVDSVRPAIDASSPQKARDRVSAADRHVATPDLDSAPPRASARVTTAHFVLLLAPREAAPAPLKALQTRPSADDGAAPLRPCRLGIVASKKIGPAVIRNRAKRLLREAFRLRNSLFPGGIDLVVIARPGASDLSLDAVIREMEGIASILGRRARQVLQK